MQPALSVYHLCKSFEQAQIVRDISFSVQPGELLGIVGPNGAGKSTTIKSILGLVTPTSGKVTIFGGKADSLQLRNRVGYMPETPSFFSHLSGSELLHFAGSLFGMKGKSLTARVNELLAKVGLEAAGKKPLSSYSKGMLQRICLAQALINKPELLFLDEPMDGLDPIGRIRMKELLISIKKEGTAIVLNSHILSDVAELADQIAIMDQGTLVAYDTTANLIPKGKTLEEVFIAKLGIS